MNKTIEHLTVIVLFMLLSSCMPAPAMVDGAVEGLQLGSTLWVCNEALTSQLCSTIIQKGAQTVLAAWMPDARQVGFVLLDGNRDLAVHDAIISGGNVTSPATFEGFKSALRSKGWAVKQPQDVPSNILILVDGALCALTQAASWMASTPVTFIVISFAEQALPEFMRQEMH